MTAAVVVELSAADVSSPYAPALLDTCNIGMHSRARCVLGTDAAPDGQGLAVAILTWGATRSEARIEVGLRVRGRPHWQGRVLSFSSADPELERWRTAGFAIATLVGEAVVHDETESKTEAVISVAPPETSSAPEDGENVPAQSWLDGQFVVAGGAPGFSPARGGEVRFSRILDGDRWFVTGAVQCTVQWTGLDSISVLRPSASAGGGVVALRLGNRLHLALHVDVALELIEVSGTDPVTGASGSGGHGTVGLGQGVDISWLWSHAVGVTAGAEVNEAAGPTEIRAHGQMVARIPAVDVTARAGLRFTIP
jgi:hypothetical protein